MKFKNPTLSGFTYLDHQRPKRPLLDLFLGRYIQFIDILKGYHKEKFDYGLMDYHEYLTPSDFFVDGDVFHHCANPASIPLFEEVAQEWNEFYNYDIDYEKDIEEQIINKYNEFYEIKNNIIYDYVYLTVRPEESVDFSQFFKKSKKAFTKKWITDYTLVFEQIGKEDAELGKGFHLHALIKLPANKQHSDARVNFQNTFKTIANRKGCVLDPVIKGTENKVRKYMGIKEDSQEFIDPNTYDFKNTPDKFPALPYDERFRLLKGLKKVYTQNDPL